MRRWQFRLIALGLGFLPFLLIEIFLRSFDVASSSQPHDPFLDFSQLRPLFEISEEGVARIPESRYRLFAPAEFKVAKSARTKRIFAIGGSTTQGEPYGPPTAFPQWLKLNLELIDPSYEYEVINCGGLSYASYRVLPILREVLGYAPDLIVIYSGQNEFLEARELEGWQRVVPGTERWLGWLFNLRTVRVLNQWLLPVQEEPRQGSDKTELQTEVDALLDYQGGLEKYKRENLQRDATVASFRWNLEAMVDACREHQVPVILMVPSSNLKDCPPFKIEEANDLAPEQSDAVHKLWEQVVQGSDDTQAIRTIAEEILQIDAEHAGAHYWLGQHASANQDWAAAKDHLTLAKEFDVCPLRAPRAIQNVVRDIARLKDVPCLDVDQRLEALSPHQIVGREWMVDHIHPTIEGHQRLGEWLCDLLVEMDWCVGVEQTNEGMDRRDAYGKHIATLGEEYFLRGKQRLEGLILWTQGRAKKVGSQIE